MTLKISAELQGHFLRLYELAISDSCFSQTELKMLYKFAEQRSISQESLNELLLSPSEDFKVPEDVETKIEYLYDFSCMIWADGIVDDEEINTLKKYCKKFNFLDENIDQLSQYMIDSVKEGKSKSEVITELIR